MRLVSAWVVVALACACSPLTGGDAPDQWQAVDVTVLPVEAPAERVGRLIYRGGLELRSDDPTFVGLSGIEVLENNRVIAISDEADWIEAYLQLDESGTLVGFAGVRTAWMRNENGRAFATKREGDSEGLAQLPDGRFAVSFERTHVIRIYDLNRDGPFGAAEWGPRIEGVQSLAENSGMEALASADLALVTGAEGGQDRSTPFWLAPLNARTPVESRYAYPLRDGFSLTGMDRLPDGSFVAVERFYAPVIGGRARIVRFVLKESGEIQTEELASLEPPFPVDNFEGISAVRMPDGLTRLYIVSDNNKRRQQRTLLLAFDLVEDQPER